jgi:hypothetical protein
MLKSTLIKAAQASGALIAERINGKFSIEKKAGPNDLVTEVDKASEALIMDIIRKDFPDHFILSEEIGEVKMDSQYKWIIDPIDGTVNFANGIPLCCVSIGIEHEGNMIMGAVYNPMMNEFFFCEKGQGAFPAFLIPTSIWKMVRWTFSVDLSARAFPSADWDQPLSIFAGSPPEGSMVSMNTNSMRGTVLRDISWWKRPEEK